MEEIEGIQRYLREEIERVHMEIEEKHEARFYSDAALLQSKEEGLIWVWNLIAGFKK